MGSRPRSLRPHKEEDKPPSNIFSPALTVEDRIIKQHSYVKDLISEEDFKAVNRVFPFMTSSYYYSLADKRADDPLMRQLCPSIEEIREIKGLSEDPLAEEKTSPVEGLIHRYPDRVLMILTNICFVNCRHCTRKRLWKRGRRANPLSVIKRMIAYVEKHPQIRDVILSGGDPLTMSNEMLDEVLGRLRRIPHVEIIRIGSRTPVVYPWRVTDKLISVLKKYKPLWFNTQFNHVREITPFSSEAVQKILEAGIPVNNQSVLLKGVNDTAEDMTALCQGLLKIMVRPYYLFHCDPVMGAGHFRTRITKGIEIMEKMRGFTSGLAIPIYVVDAVGGGGKIPLQPDYVKEHSGDKLVLRNYEGRTFTYSDDLK